MNPSHCIFRDLVHSLKRPYATNSWSSTDDPGQKVGYSNKVLIVEPQIHRDVPRLRVCIEHHLMISGLKLGKLSKGPQRSPLGKPFAKVTVTGQYRGVKETYFCVS